MDKDLLSNLAQDKYLHYKYGFILYLFFSLFTNKGLQLVSLIAKTKEFIDGLGFGTKDIEDYNATVAGAEYAVVFIKENFNRG